MRFAPGTAILWAVVPGGLGSIVRVGWAWPKCDSSWVIRTDGRARARMKTEPERHPCSGSAIRAGNKTWKIRYQADESSGSALHENAAEGAALATRRDTLSRRQFLAHQAALTAGFLSMPAIIPAHVLAAPGRPGANDRIGVGYIGAGRRANQLMELPATGRGSIASSRGRSRSRTSRSATVRPSCVTWVTSPGGSVAS